MHFRGAHPTIVLLFNIVGSLPCLNLPSYMEMMLSGIFFFLDVSSLRKQSHLKLTDFGWCLVWRCVHSDAFSLSLLAVASDQRDGLAWQYLSKQFWMCDSYRETTGSHLARLALWPSRLTWSEAAAAASSAAANSQLTSLLVCLLGVQLAGSLEPSSQNKMPSDGLFLAVVWRLSSTAMWL